MESDSFIVNSFSEDNLENSKIDLNIKTLNFNNKNIYL